MSESPDHTPLSARRGMGWVLTGYGVLNIAVALQQLVAGDTDALFALAVMGFGLTWVGQRLLKKDRLLRAARQHADDPIRRLEGGVLHLAKQEGGRLGVVEVAAALGAPLDDAERTLRALVERGAAEELITEAGVSVFRFPELEVAGLDKRDLLEG